MRSFSPLLVPMCFFFMLCLGGCGPTSEKLSEVSGKVFVGGKPAEGAVVILVPASAIDDPNAPRPRGVVDSAGDFTLATYNVGNGARPGDYVVVISWFDANAREQTNPKNKISDQFADPKKTPLRATVKEEPTVLEPFKVH